MLLANEVPLRKKNRKCPKQRRKRLSAANIDLDKKREIFRGRREFFRALVNPFDQEKKLRPIMI